MLKQRYHAQLHALLAILVPQWQATMQTPAVRTAHSVNAKSLGEIVRHALGVLTFATGLVHYPHDVIAYAVIDELAHLFHPNHAPPFWQCVTRYCPQSAYPTQRTAPNMKPEQGGMMDAIPTHFRWIFAFPCAIDF
jgi:predicted metal-dependent hydrolase